MDRDRSWQVIDQHRVIVADILAGLTPEQWETPSLCEGWRVREVGAHLSMAATMGLRDVLPFAVRARGNYNGMIHEGAIDRAERPPEQIVADLRGIVGTRKLAPFTVWRDPLFDILVHAQDISRPLGIDVDSPADALVESAEWAWRVRFRFSRARRLKGVRLVAEDVDWSRGAGEELRGPMVDLLLLACGRPAGLRGTSGPGRAVLEERFATAA